MNNEYIYIHRHIDSLPMFLNWEVDSILIILLTFGVSINFSSNFINMVIFICLGFIVSYLYTKIKNSAIRGYFSHLKYIFNFKEPKTLIPSYQRHFIGK